MAGRFTILQKGDAPSGRALIAPGKDPDLGQVERNVTMFKPDQQFDLYDVSHELANYPDKTTAAGGSLTSGDAQKLYRALEGLNLARDNDKVWGIIKTNFPDAEVSLDKAGNPVVTIPSLKVSGYLNRPGLSRQDVVPAVTEVLTTGLGALAGGIFGRSAGKAARVAAEMGGAAAGSLAQDVSANWQGFGSPKLRAGDVGRAVSAGVGTGAGIALGGVLARLTPQAKAIVANTPLTAEHFSGATWTPVGNAMLRKADLSPDDITPQTFAALQDTLKKGVDPAASLRQAEAQGLPNPVDLTAGQATRDPAALGLESWYKKTGKGGMEEQTAQQDALQGNVDTIAGNLAGRDIRRGEGAASARAYLDAERKAQKAGVNQAYDTARDAGQGVYFDTKPVAEFAKGVRGELDRQRLTRYGAVSQRLKDLDALTLEGGNGVNLNDLMDWRRDVTNDIRTMTASVPAGREVPPEVTGLMRLKQAFDRQIVAAAHNDLLKGNVRGIQAWKTAIGKRADFGDMFGRDDIVNTLTAVDRNNRNVLKADAPDAVNYIFGRQGIGRKNDFLYDMQRLKEVLPKDQWNLIRAEAFLRLVPQYDQASVARMFPSAQYSKALSLALENNPDAMATLFTKDEIKLFRQFGRVAGYVNTAPKVAADMNPSGTATSAFLGETINRLGSLFGPAGGYVTNILNGFAKAGDDIARTRAAAQSMRGVIKPLPRAAPPGSGAAGALTGAETSGHLKREDDRTLRRLPAAP